MWIRGDLHSSIRVPVAGFQKELFCGYERASLGGAKHEKRKPSPSASTGRYQEIRQVSKAGKQRQTCLINVVIALQGSHRDSERPCSSRGASYRGQDE